MYTGNLLQDGRIFPVRETFRIQHPPQKIVW